MNDIISRVRVYIKEKALLAGGERIIVALSGGADSVFLLLALRELNFSSPLQISALHINHLLRGDEAYRDEEFCRELCDKWDIPLDVCRLRVKAYCKAKGVGIEEGARQLRYKVYSRVSAKNRALIALGHTADDVVETYLFNLIRGSGFIGLTGIPPRRDFIIRPILGLWRKEISQYLQGRNIAFMQDSSNLLHIYTRNKIRNELIPSLEQFNPRVKKHIFQSAEVLFTLREVVEGEVERLWKDALLYNKHPILIFSDKISSAPLVVLGELLKRVFAFFGFGLADFDFNLVERVKRGRGLVELIGNRGFSCYIARGRVFFFRGRGFSSYAIAVSGKGVYMLPGDLGSIEVDLVKRVDSVIHRDETVGYIAYNGGDLAIRTSLRGDYFNPLGGSIKRLSRYFIDKGIPRFLRRYLPLFVVDGKIAWVGGCGVSEDFKVKGRDRGVLKIIWRGGLSELMRRSELWRN